MLTLVIIAVLLAAVFAVALGLASRHIRDVVAAREQLGAAPEAQRPRADARGLSS